jgi:hypothetical protein
MQIMRFQAELVHFAVYGDTMISPEERAALLAAFDEPIPLMQHPFVMDVLERIPCTKIKDLEPVAPKLDNSANKLPRLPGETTEQLSLRRNQAWYEANKAFLERVT